MRHGINNLHYRESISRVSPATACVLRYTPFSAQDEGHGGKGSKPGLRLGKTNARLPPSGVTACGVLWVEPGDPMTRRPSSIVLI